MELHSKQSTIIVAHRGASHAAPENTLPAFQLAWQEKADFIEGDFWMTADQQIVCIHDKNTARVAKDNINLNVQQSTLEELQQVDVGSWKGQAFNGVRIPTLQEILAIIPPNKGLFLEIKDTRLPFLEQTQKIVNDFAILPQQLRFIAFDPEVVKNARRIFPDFKIYWLYNWYRVKGSHGFSNTASEILNMVQLLPCDGLNINPFPWIDVDFVQRLRTLNKDFCVYSVQSFSDALKYVTLGVDAITTNRPAKIRHQLEHYFNPKALDRSRHEELRLYQDKHYIFKNHPLE